jgi:catechol 2,3-dioxygenase-like lactoylglutathione lyase family enzyme
MAGIYRINPRFRAYGKARIDVTLRAKDEKEWQSMWKPPVHPYPFPPGEGWKFCIEYRVDDFAAEIGFFIDVLGFSVYSFSPSYAQFVSPDQGFLFGVSAIQEGEQSTLPDTLRLKLNVSDLLATVQELERRGIIFEQPPAPMQEGTRLQIAVFRTPHGIPIDLWGEGELTANQSAPGLEELNTEAPDNRIEQQLITGEDQIDTEGISDASESEAKDEQEKETPHKEQIGLWGHFSRSAISLKEKSLRSEIPVDDQAEKPKPGNGEVTYAPIEDDDSDLEDQVDEEDYP